MNELTKATKLFLFLLTFIFVSASAFAQTISITPTSPDTGDLLTCLVDGVNDPFYIYQWDKVGVSDTPVESNPLAASNTEQGDTWRCKVFIPSYPSDIAVPGSAQVSIAGEPELELEISITPDPAYDDDALTCRVNGEADPFYIYKWDRIGVTDTPIEANPLPASYTSVDQTWRCKVYVPSYPTDIAVPGDARTTIQEQPLVCVDLDGDGYGLGDDCAGPDNCPSNSNPSQTNTDGDSQGNACDSDDDNDGVADGPDNCNVVANPGQENADGGSAGDACDTDDDNDNILDGPDNCDLIANPSQTDTDGDGLGNACDDDNDNDGILDGPDNCNDVYNPDQENFDMGVAGDVCDSDDDNDGAADDADNCPYGDGDDVYDPLVDNNPDQTDADADGVGDLCDADFCADTDGDGYGDGAACLGVDNCPADFNPAQEDTDSDGLGDACDPDVACYDPDGDAYGTGASCLGPDNCPVDFNPDQNDADIDGVGDACDSDVACYDPDGDGYGVGDVCIGLDNCPLNNNPDQLDFDSDAAGDVCDNDNDNDGVTNDVDNCPLGDGDLTYELGVDDNADQTDADGDGVGDVCDISDTEAPTVVLNTPENGETVTSSSVNFTYFVLDNVDTTLSCTLHVNINGIDFEATQTAHHFIFDELTNFSDLNTFTLTGVSLSDGMLSVPQGTYIWNVECVDAAGNSAFASTDFTFTVNTTVPPIEGTSPVISISAEPTAGEAPLDVSFTASVTGGDGDLTFLWDFGDGDTSTKRSPLHYYEDDGTYTVTLTVTDEDGDYDTAFIDITVGEEEERGDELIIRRIVLTSLAGMETAYPGSDVVMRLTLENNGHRELENVRVSVAIPDLAVRRYEGPFDLSIGEVDTAVVRLEVPEYAEPGEYDVHISAGNNDITRFRNRVIWIMEP
ncbi:thrombospondin type 3 repeat-containing protein [Candidatus Woesearchaeota archaeon]|nr:thrombospondin type 3 repeat-containing protein [Candidatus Woesearchaeota archaeon]